MQQRSGNMLVVVGLLVLAVVFVIGAIYYFTTQTHLLADAYGHHSKHAILCVILAVLCLIGANFARRAQA
jgi:accessory gene regulator protein AgrB